MVYYGSYQRWLGDIFWNLPEEKHGRRSQGDKEDCPQRQEHSEDMLHRLQGDFFLG
jgi:hypothetical protein